jgi:hypothetical protein
LELTDLLPRSCQLCSHAFLNIVSGFQHARHDLSNGGGNGATDNLL